MIITHQSENYGNYKCAYLLGLKPRSLRRTKHYQVLFNDEPLLGVTYADDVEGVARGVQVWEYKPGYMIVDKDINFNEIPFEYRGKGKVVIQPQTDQNNILPLNEDQLKELVDAWEQYWLFKYGLEQYGTIANAVMSKLKEKNISISADQHIKELTDRTNSILEQFKNNRTEIRRQWKKINPDGTLG